MTIEFDKLEPAIQDVAIASRRLIRQALTDGYLCGVKDAELFGVRAARRHWEGALTEWLMTDAPNPMPRITVKTNPTSSQTGHDGICSDPAEG